MRKICLIITLVTLAASGALTSTEFPGLYDARSAGMGGTGAAYLDSAAAMYANPAALDQIGRSVWTLDCSTVWSKMQAPMPVVRSTGIGYEPLESEHDISTVFFIGLAYRVRDWIVVGAGMYPTSGFGVTYKDYQPMPEALPHLKVDLEAYLGVMELAFPVSVRIRDNLSVAVMWRPTYFSETCATPVIDPNTHSFATNSSGASVGENDLDISDWNLKGIQVGVFYQPVPRVRLGFSYRNKLKFKAKGDTDTINPADGSAIALDTVVDYAAPHLFRGGVALMLSDRVLLAADVKYILYKDSNEDMTTATTLPGGTQLIDTLETRWENTVEIALGGEYELSDRLAVRLGYSNHNSATPEAYARALCPSPGTMHTFHTGLGVKAMKDFTVDLGISYLYLDNTITTATDTTNVGRYKSECGVFALSATYRK
ncbi:MAG TPA: outer membrane protein transport protein [Deltaproteobacteria bacterium]|nr:outer membrane protein transport protein [Deltaproteobacteria bacterium]